MHSIEASELIISPLTYLSKPVMSPEPIRFTGNRLPYLSHRVWFHESTAVSGCRGTFKW